jgi:hypothetical protein
MGELIEQNTDSNLVIGIDPGHTISEILEKANIPAGVMPFVVVSVNGTNLAEDQFPFFVPRENDHIGIWVRPAGGDSGKQILRLVATIVVAVIAYQYGGAALFADLGAKVGLEAATSQIIASAVIATVGALVINALIPPPSINLPNSGFDTGESYFITGQRNSARPYEIVPVVYGTTKIVANLAAQPEIFSAGDSTVFTALLDFGLGDVFINDIRAGDTQIQFFNATKIEHTHTPSYANPNRPQDGLSPVPLQLLQYPLKSQELSVGLSTDADQGTANTVPTAFSAVVELTFPQGIAFYDKNGELQTLGVSFNGEYKSVDSEEWLPWPNGTEGYAGDDALWFGTGNVDPGNPNPPEDTSVDITVPVRATEGDLFVITISFNQAVYQVDEEDFRFFRATDTVDVTDQFVRVSAVEITPNQVWQYQYRAPNITGAVKQYFVATNLQNFVDGPPPDGITLPNTAYVSNNFQVVDENTGGPGGPDPEPDDELYDRTPGNETYVVVSGSGALFNYAEGDTGTWFQSVFSVFVKGVQVSSSTAGFMNYSGVFQDSVISPGFLGTVQITEYWTLKNGDGSAGRMGGGFNGRFLFPNLPNWDPSLLGARFSLYGNAVKPGKASIVIQFPEMGEYQVRVTRVGDTENNDSKNQYFNACYWTRIASRGYPFNNISDGRRSILNLSRFHTMMEIRLEASETIQGNLNQITATATSRLRGHNGTSWTEPTGSRNPAWIVADLLTGYHAQQVRYPYDGQDCPGYVTADQIDLASFRRFAAVCSQKVSYEYKGETVERFRYTSDFVCSNKAPLMETIQNILGMARAALILGQNGKIQIMMDEDRADEVRQVFTPANSWGFSGERLFPRIPHALKVEFVSPELGYQKGEVIVFRPGYSEANATLLEPLKTFACTNWHMAAQFGMYSFGQMVLRQEKFTLKVAAESLVVQRGDVVEVATDVAALGGGAHLIVSHPSPDTFILSEEPNDYDNAHYTIKTNEGVFQGDVIGQVGRTVQLDRNFQPVNADDTNVIVIGQQGFVTKKYIIATIRPLVDFSAELTLVPYDAALYDTDNGSFPEWSPGGDGDPQNPENGGNARADNLQGFSYLEYDNRQPISVSSLTWDLATADAQIASWEIQWTQSGQDTRIDIDLITADKRAYEHRYQSNSNEFGPGIYTVTPIMQLGYRAQARSVFVGQSIDRLPPGPPRKFRAVAEPGWTKFFWERPDAPDIGGYQIYGLRRIDNDYNEITEDDINHPSTFLVSLVDWDEFYHYEPLTFAQNGMCFWISCTDTSGNTSELAYFDGLQFGVPKPGLVEPFDIITDAPARLYWLDLVDPNNLIQGYELRFSPNENQEFPSSGDTQTMDFVPPAYAADRTHEYLLGPGGWPEEGAWWIRARDRFGFYGPWNRTSTAELDYQIVITNDYQEMFYVDRMPFTKSYTSWVTQGEMADQVNKVRAWLYPRQAEGRNIYDHEWLSSDMDLNQFLPAEQFEGTNPNGPDGRSGPWLLWTTTDPEVIANGTGWFEIAQLPRGDIYHQGQIVVEGLVDDVSLGTQKGIQEWQIEYDNIGPAAPVPLLVREIDEESIELTWTLPADPDPDEVELRYARRIDMPWDEAEPMDRIAWEDQVYVDGNMTYIAENRPGKYMVRYTDTSDNPGQIAEVTFDAGGIDTDGWTLLQSIQGHNEWIGVLDGLERRDGVTTIFMSAGLSEAFFYYDEDTNIPTLGETRIISETLVPYGSIEDPWEFISDWPTLGEVETMAQTGGGSSNLEIYHEVQLPGSEFWQQFEDSAFPISGQVKYRIRLVNLTPEEEIGIEKSRILVYAKEEQNP